MSKLPLRPLPVKAPSPAGKLMKTVVSFNYVFVLSRTFPTSPPVFRIFALFGQ